jgi:hypothetical protein
MTRATIPTHRKHLYFYTLLVLVTFVLGSLKPIHGHKTETKSRASEVNKLAKTLFP